MIRALVTGARGQVGVDLVRAFDGRAQVFAHDRSTLDLARPEQIEARLAEIQPQLILNAAAYTAVDRAESEPQLARAVNATAPGILARHAKRTGALLVHYSTDYVFDGRKAGAYVEDDATGPLGVYGGTKLEGEREIAASGCAHVILRTSWVYSAHGANFVRTMLRLGAEREELRVVDDQHGAPTSSAQLARAARALFTADEDRAVAAADLERVARSSGIYHATAQGETTWCGFAQAIFAAWAQRQGPAFRVPRVVPIATREYPTPAKRPANSVLSNARLAATFGVRLGPWPQALDEVLSELGGR